MKRNKPTTRCGGQALHETMRMSAFGASLLLSSAVSAQVATTCPAALETTQLFPFSGAPTTFTVPANVNNVRFISVGADGGNNTNAAFTAGVGAQIEGTFAVTPGQQFTVIVGGAGGNGGDLEAGGGGASGVYFGTSGSTLLMIAGGGGGDDNTGNGGGGTVPATAGVGSNGSNGGAPAGSTCNAGGLGGTGGAGGEFGEIPPPAGCETGQGGAGGGGLNAAGGSSAINNPTPGRAGPRGGAQCSILGAAGGAGGRADPTDSATGNPGVGSAGGFGLCGGGGSDHRESGGGGGWAGGGGGPEGQFPGGGGSFLAASATASTFIAGSTGGGSGRDGSVRVCYTTRADLSITKTNTPASGPNDQPADTLASGSATTYTIVATNSGAASANGALITDPVPTGLICTTATCSATGGATCPAQTGAALVTALQGAGVTLPTMPVGGTVTITLSCTVN